RNLGSQLLKLLKMSPKELQKRSPSESNKVKQPKLSRLLRNLKNKNFRTRAARTPAVYINGLRKYILLKYSIMGNTFCLTSWFQNPQLHYLQRIQFPLRSGLSPQSRWEQSY